MIATTTTRLRPKPFAWSYSKLKNFESCAFRFQQVDLLKKFREEEGEQLLWGNAVHKALAERIEKSTPLPKGMDKFESWAEKILAGGGTFLVEQQLAINADFGPTKWFGNDAWYRGIADVIKIAGPVALVVDWKTGKVLEDGVQLALMAACVFAHHPNVQRIRSEFVWLREDATTRADFTREGMAEMWRGIWPRIEQMKSAYETDVYPQKAGGLCKRYCPVTVCPHHGEG